MRVGIFGDDVHQRLWVFFLLYDRDQLPRVTELAADLTDPSSRDAFLTSLQDSYGCWRFFEVWDALEDFYLGAAPERVPAVPMIMKDWAPGGLGHLLMSIEAKYQTSHFTSRGLLPLNDAGAERTQVVELYKRYDPERLACVGAMMSAYRGHETELIQMLALKYECPPPEPLHLSPPRDAGAPDWDAFVVALRRKDDVLRKQAQALMQQRESLRSERERMTQIQSVVPRQQDTLEQLFHLTSQLEDRGDFEKLLKGQALEELQRQNRQLGGLAKILGVPPKK
eukprot:Hpha_TRINITY_DN16452_c1_g9::TRINITY_DN16452_c1_g9_i1::g.161472::m.161472